MKNLITSFKLVALTLLVCCVAYPLTVLAFAQAITPNSADGSLLTNADGEVIGSRLIAQSFVSPRYFWPRPSAADYNAQGAGGSNLSPSSPALTERAKALVSAFGASAERPLPADLVTASGAGLDPHISEAAALYQVARVAAARGWTEEKVEALVEAQAVRIGGALVPDKIVPVLALNIALDQAEDVRQTNP